MKKAAIIKIIAASVLIIILTTILIIVLIGEDSMFRNIFNGLSGYSYSDSKDYKPGNAEVSVEGINELNIDWIAGSVKISTHSGEGILVSETSSDSLDDDDKLRYLVKDGVLYIKYWTSKGIFSFGRMFTPTKNLTVYIPENKADILSTLKIDAVSASTSVDNISANNIDLESVSGKIELSMKSISNSIKAEAVSGEINIKAITSIADFESVSGRILFAGEVNEIDCESVSGKVNIKSDICPKKVDVETVSGRTTLSIPENNGFTIKYDKVSGSFNCNFATINSNKKVVYGDGSGIFVFSTVSGSINIIRQ